MTRNEVAGTGAGIAATVERQPMDTTTNGRDVADGSGADGLIGIYAMRAVERGVDWRPLITAHRVAIGALAPRASEQPAGNAPRILPVRQVGRGTALHRAEVRKARRAGRPRSSGPIDLVATFQDVVQDWLAPGRTARAPRPGRRLLTTGLVVAILFAGGIGAALAENQPPQQRYQVQAGDSLDDLAASFGVEPAAILAASALRNPPALTPAEVIVIPAPGQTPAEAAAMAVDLNGTSPFVAAAHQVAPGETLATIAGDYDLAADTLADFNGLTDPNVLNVGQRLLIPAVPTGGVGTAALPAVGGPTTAVSPVGVILPNVPTHAQERNLSCEYAAAFIATSALGAGIPERVFAENVPQAQNPHWGYRGNIDGWWGNTDDYGVYPEALEPTLAANGYTGETFYSFGEAEPLRERIDAGMPVITWLGYWGDTGVTLEDEGTYTVAAGMHVVVVYGYDAGGVHVSNPARGTYEYYSWADFLAMWSVLDGMALAVAPA